MKNAVRGLLVVAALLGSANVSNANSIINGSFETPDCDVLGACSAGTWGLFETIPGWTSPVGLIEIGEAFLYGISGHDGDQVLELDSTGNATVAQVVAGPGVFQLSFLYADRAGGLNETFDVYWNSVLLGSFAPGSTAMSLYSTTVIAVAGTNELAFVSTGVSDSLGALIDDVQLNQVPDGGLTAMLLGVGMFGLARLRRMLL